MTVQILNLNYKIFFHLLYIYILYNSECGVLAAIVAVIPSAPVNRNARDIIRQEILVRDGGTGILSGKINCFRDG
jgi:hypothetical protein